MTTATTTTTILHLLLALWLQPATLPRDADAWRADLRLLAEELPRRHIDPFTKLSRATFDDEVTRLDADAASLTLDEFHVRLLQLIARIGDGHTTLAWTNAQTDFGRLPLSIVRLKDGYFINAAPRDRAELLGAKLLRIGDVDVDEAARRVATLFPYENEPSLHNGACWWLAVPEALHVLGVVPSQQNVGLHVRTREGLALAATLGPAPRGKRIEFAILPAHDAVKMPTLVRQRPAYYWFEHVPEQRAVYVRYDRCANDPKKMILLFCKELFEFLDAHEADVGRVVIDLRRNGGGNSLVLAPVIQGLSMRAKFKQPGKLLVLIGPHTFSSAMMNALQLKQQAGATLLGQPTGQKPNSFGEVKSFALPNVGAKVLYSTKRFTMIAGDDPPSLAPDVLVEPSGDDYFSGRDIALERALEWAP